jgi:hypothetical protein
MGNDEMIFSGNDIEDMEIAKRLIANHANVNLSKLIAIAKDRAQPQSARIAAIYTLGFTDDNGLSRSTLIQISQNSNEPAEIREYATEAVESFS